MIKRICSWGNSSGVRIPKNVLSETGMDCGDEVNIKTIDLEDGKKGILVTATNVDNDVMGLSKKRVDSILKRLL